jgi:two-component system sensor histidine kinase RstB
VNSIFLRIYGGMLLILVVVSLLALLGIRQVNEFRAETYREEIATGTFRLMADNLQAMEGTERLRALAAWTRLIGVPLQLRSLTQVTLDSRQRSQLARGRVLVKPLAENQVQVFSQVDEHTVLTTDIQRITEQLGRATLFLLVDELVRHPESDMPARLQRLRQDKNFGYTLMLTRMREADLDADQRRRLEEFDTVMTLGPDGDSVLLYMKVTDTDWVLRLGPLFQMEDYPRELLLITGLLVLTLSGLLIYLLVRQLERRLITLEAAAMLLSHGNLDARVNAAGQDPVGRVARAFNDMASHLQRLMKIQQEMIGAVSHELRTPIARLRFGLEMVETSKNDKDIAHYAQGMDADLSELDLLVDEILTYARLEQGAPALSMVLVDVPALIDRVIHELAPLNQAIEIDLVDNSYGRANAVEAEERYLTRALSNLITNAMRHASRRVRVNCQVVYGRCVVSVQDDGPGIDEQLREKVFTPFLRLDDSRTRASGGYGLGLSIVRRVMYWHSGTARAGESATLGGADFILEWPLRRG